MLRWSSSYPLCNIPGHHPDLSTPIHDVSASTALPRAVLDNNALVPTSPPDAPTLSVFAPAHVDENPTDMPLVDNMSAPASLCHAHQTATESVRDSATSSDPTAAAPQDNPSALTISPDSCGTSTSTSSVPLPTAISFQNNANPLLHVDAPEIPSSAFPEPALDDITCPSLLAAHLLSQSCLIPRY
jgi:hypothetical protein